MNFKKLISYLLTLSLVLLGVALFAQDIILPAENIVGIDDPFTDGQTSQDELLEWYHALYGALVLLWGYVGKAFKITAKVPNYVFVVIAGALVIFGGFVALGFTNFFPFLFSFLSAIGIYDIILKPIQAGIANRKALKEA